VVTIILTEVAPLEQSDEIKLLNRIITANRSGESGSKNRAIVVL